MTVAAIEYVLRSDDASWCYDMWEPLPNDGNRYEVIDCCTCQPRRASYTNAQLVVCISTSGFHSNREGSQ